MEAALKIVFEHPFLVLLGPEDLNGLLKIEVRLRILLRSLKLHVWQVVKDEVHILDEFVKLSFVTF